MVFVVDIRDLLDEHGYPAQPTRRRGLRLARLIEYGGPLTPRHTRETLVECSRRPRRKPCEGLLWVVKTDDHRIEAFCPVCKQELIVISGWEETDWAEGPMEPAPLDDLPTDH